MDTPDEILNVISGYPAKQRDKLFELRDIILKTALSIDAVSDVEECLKWGQPSFIAKPKGVGSTVRIDKHEEGVAVYFICNTNLVETFREIYPDKFCFEGNRALVFEQDKAIPTQELSHCIAMALTYHLNKRKAAI